MPLHVIIGYARQDRASTPAVVYAGQSKEEARAAMAADHTSVRFECLHNVTGHRKNNPNVAVNLAPEVIAEAPSDPSDPSSDAPSPAPHSGKRRRT